MHFCYRYEIPEIAVVTDELVPYGKKPAQNRSRRKMRDIFREARSCRRPVLPICRQKTAMEWDVPAVWGPG